MAIVSERQGRTINLGDGYVEMQEWKVERLADDTFEWHSYIGHYYGRSGSPLHTKGAVWMIMRLKDPASIEEEMLYRMGRTGLPGSGNDILETEWNARAVSTFYRFDEMLTQFFS